MYQADFKKRISNIKKDSHMFSNVKASLGCRSFEKVPNILLTSSQLLEAIPGNDAEALMSVSEGSELIQVCNDGDKANVFGKHYENIHDQNNELGDREFSESVDDAMKSWSSCLDSDGVTMIRRPIVNFSPILKSDSEKPAFRHFTSPKQLKDMLKRLKNKKSSGFDQIPNAVIRKLTPAALRVLCILFNNCLNISYFPEGWKLANVVPIRKPKKVPYEVVSYRPISLLSNLSKLLERLILNWIHIEMDSKGLKSDCQFGFKRFHSTNHALLMMSEDVLKALTEDKFTVAVFLDSEKAFDTVWINGLVWKMKFVFGFDDNLCLLVMRFLTNRTFKVSVNGKTSRASNMRAGTPQGSVLSPVLYAIFTLDIPRSDLENDPKLIQFADDTSTYHSSDSMELSTGIVNGYLKVLADYYNRWKIKINPSNSESIVFRRPSPYCGKNIMEREKNLKIEVNSIPVPKKKRVKYLGVNFDYLWRFNEHGKSAVRKGQAAKNLLYPVMNASSKVDVGIKILCYKQLIRPMITYGFPTWFNVSKTSMNKIRIFERKCLRQCNNIVRTPDDFKFISNDELYARSRVVPIDSYMFGLCERFVDNLVMLDNSLIESVVRSQSDTRYFDQCLQSKRYLPVSGLKYFVSEGLVWNSDGVLKFYV